MRAMIASAVLLLPLAATTVEAQQPQVLSQRVAKSMPSAYRAPDCGLKSGHFKVSSGATYLKTGIETDVPDNQKRALDSGEKVLLEAMQQNNQGRIRRRGTISAASTSSVVTSTARIARSRGRRSWRRPAPRRSTGTARTRGSR